MLCCQLCGHEGRWVGFRTHRRWYQPGVPSWAHRIRQIFPWSVSINGFNVWSNKSGSDNKLLQSTDYLQGGKRSTFRNLFKSVERNHRCTYRNHAKVSIIHHIMFFSISPTAFLFLVSFLFKYYIFIQRIKFWTLCKWWNPKKSPKVNMKIIK